MFLLGVILVALAVLGFLTVLALQAAELLRHPCAAAAASAVTLHAIAASPDLRARYPRRSLINESGVQAANELIAYIRVPRGER